MQLKCNNYVTVQQLFDDRKQCKCDFWHHYSPSMCPLVGIKFREETSQL